MLFLCKFVLSYFCVLVGFHLSLLFCIIRWFQACLFLRYHVLLTCICCDLLPVCHGGTSVPRRREEERTHSIGSWLVSVCLTSLTCKWSDICCCVLYIKLLPVVSRLQQESKWGIVEIMLMTNIDLQIRVCWFVCMFPRWQSAWGTCINIHCGVHSWTDAALQSAAVPGASYM